jgi:hypothetical protein
MRQLGPATTRAVRRKAFVALKRATTRTSCEPERLEVLQRRQLQTAYVFQLGNSFIRKLSVWAPPIDWCHRRHRALSRVTVRRKQTGSV